VHRLVGLAVVLTFWFGCSAPPSEDAGVAREQAERAWGWSELGSKVGDPKHGEYLATICACKECHTVGRTSTGAVDPAQLFAGGSPAAGPWGVVAPANVSVIAGSMPPAQLEDMIRGRLAYKFQMPTILYAEMAAEDMRDLIAYLETVRPIERPPFRNVYARGFRPPPPNPILRVPEHAPAGVTVERGRYLTTVAGCKDCHSPRLPDGVHFDEEHLLSGGGVVFHTADGRPLVPPNLTPDPDGGLGGWSDDEIIRAIRTGVGKDGRRLDPAMPSSASLGALTDEDVRAVVEFLRSLRPVRR
jgi:mono/diheme cytochrome c family protein